MRNFLLILILTFSFQTLTKADDIRDFKIEGMSVGDILLDYYSLIEINKAKEAEGHFEGEKTYYFESNLSLYERVRIYTLDKNDKIVSITGEKFVNYKKCLNLQKQIIMEFNDLFDLSSVTIGELDNFITVNDPTGQSFFTDYSIFFKNNDIAYIRCYSYTEESNIEDRLEVAVYLKVHDDIMEKSNGVSKKK